MQRPLAELTGAEAEGGDIVDPARKVLVRGIGQHQNGFDRVRHGHEGNARFGIHETGIGFALRGSVQHLGAVIAGAAAGHGEGADQPGEANSAEIYHGGRIRIQVALTVEIAVVYAQFFTVKFIAAVHGVGGVVILFFDPPGGMFGGPGREAIDRDRTGEQKFNRLLEFFTLVGCQHQ